MDERPLRIMLADDHDIVRRGVRSLLQTVPGWEICCEASDGKTAVSEAILKKPDVLLVDVSIPPTDGLDIARQLIAAELETSILVFTMHDSEELVRDFLSAGVRGYVLKTDADRYLITAIAALAEGKTFFSQKVSDSIVSGFLHPTYHPRKTTQSGEVLSPREMEVAKLLAHGNSNKEISSALSISVKTVETHRKAIMKKLEISSVVELVYWAIREGLVKTGS